MTRRYHRCGGAHVYIAVARWRYGVKIGFSTRPVQRRVDLEQAHKARVNMVYATGLRMDAFKVERRAQQILGAKARGGEWFAVDIDTAKRVVRRAQRDVESGWSWPRMPCHDARLGSKKGPPKDWPERWR